MFRPRRGCCANSSRSLMSIRSKRAVSSASSSKRGSAPCRRDPNVMADVYLSLQSGTKLGDSQEETRWLEPEIANLREKVKEAEEKVARYRNGTDLIQTIETSTLANQQLSDISQELARFAASVPMPKPRLTMFAPFSRRAAISKPWRCRRQSGDPASQGDPEHA